MLVLNTVGDMGFGIAEEAENGTLEQLFISPLGPLRLFLIRAAVSLGMSSKNSEDTPTSTALP
jgi:ABC-2 type transport system permease protein